MRKFVLKIKDIATSYRSALSIIVIYSAILIGIAIIFYPLIPLILNYPVGTVGGNFQRELENANYTQQYALISVVVIITVSIVILYMMRGIENWPKFLNSHSHEDMSQLEIIGKRCMTLPYTIYMVQIILPSILMLVIHAFTTKTISITTMKIWTAFFSFLTLAAVISHIFSKRILTKILIRISSPMNLVSKRIGLKKKIFIQMIPMFIVALLFTSLVGYSRLVKEKGDLMFKIYSYKLEMELEDTNNIKTRVDIENLLKKVELETNTDTRFVISPNGTVSSIDTSHLILSPFFRKYINELSKDNKGRVYDYYGFDVQGAIKTINIDDQEWVLGVQYEIASNATLRFFMIGFIILLFFICLVLYYFAGGLTDDISVVTTGLKEIADGGDIDLEKKLLVTSNDEIGDLIVAFNKIQEKEKENIRSIKENQEMLMEQERLASLGQLIGGIAHNLNTPIMSIAGGIEALKDLVTEYDESIEDPNVIDSDHHEIALEMKVWLQKMKPYCSYMSEVISTVKGQAVQYSNARTSGFTVDELVKRVDILMNHELKRYHCKLNLDSHVNMNTKITGEISSLVQVFDNIIVNAIHSYGDESGIIDFKIIKNENNIVFSFQDYGSGIPPEVQLKLFKEMLTTKGKNGTGLGLYMSYSIIRGSFGGNMWFESAPAKGTTFYISIPCNRKHSVFQEVIA